MPSTENVTPGDVWFCDLAAAETTDISRLRPALVISVVPGLGQPPSTLMIVPLTSAPRGAPDKPGVELQPPEANLPVRSWAMIEQLHAMSPRRLVSKVGSVSADTMSKVQIALRNVLHL